MPSLLKTFVRWYSTVLGVMNSRAPISGVEKPSPASGAIWASWAVRSSTRRSNARGERGCGADKTACHFRDFTAAGQRPRYQAADKGVEVGLAGHGHVERSSRLAAR